ncbi:MAG: S49 family peptidase, partial [Candidatus Paceibacterota bacterium]
MPTLKSIIKKLSILIVILTVLSYWSQQYNAEFDDYLEEESYFENGPCNVSDLKLQGEIWTYTIEGESDVSSSEDVVLAIEQAEQDESIKAILLTIDSYGGDVVAGEEIANALKRTQKPTVAVIRGAGASAAYWAATGADRIFASASSDVGGIGVTMSYLDNVKRNEADGFTYNGLSAG